MTEDFPGCVFLPPSSKLSLSSSRSPGLCGLVLTSLALQIVARLGSVLCPPLCPRSRSVFPLSPLCSKPLSSHTGPDPLSRLGEHRPAWQPRVGGEEGARHPHPHPRLNTDLAAPCSRFQGSGPASSCSVPAITPKQEATNHTTPCGFFPRGAPQDVVFMGL